MSAGTSIRRLDIAELSRIGEIDRSEHITQQYVMRDRALELVDVDIRAPRWGRPGQHSVEHYIELWSSRIEAGGVGLGAFDGEALVGIAVYQRPRDGRAALSALFVSRSHRGVGVGRGLVEEVVALARADGAQRLYVSSTPTSKTVDFYRRRGFEVLGAPEQWMLDLEPDDIHLEMALSP